VPTYQYACTECGDQLERVQKFSDDPLTVCPACSGRLRKVFSPVGIVFKGSGFYRNDSRSGNGSKDAKVNEPSAGPVSKTEGSGDKGDTKPAAATPAKEPSSGSSPAPAKPSSSTSEKVA
jgi:putative FmdB family regulatory protein